MSHENLIETFQTWEEIFTSPEERARQFQGLLEEIKDEYSENHTLAREETRLNSQRNSNETIFHRTFGGYTTITSLPNGDIEIVFSTPDHKRNLQTIVPDVGIKKHDWTYDRVNLLREDLFAHITKTKDIKTADLNFKIVALYAYAKGKPATKGWQDTLVQNGYTPLRVGFKIYPQEVLDKTQELIAPLKRLQ